MQKKNIDLMTNLKERQMLGLMNHVGQSDGFSLDNLE